MRIFCGYLVAFLILTGIAPDSFGRADDPAETTWARLASKAAGEDDYSRALDYLSRIELSHPGNPHILNEKALLLLRWGEQL